MREELRNYFVPSAANDYTPHVLQRVAMLAMLGLVLLTFTATNVQALLWTMSDWMVSTVLPSVIIDLTNEERADVEVGQLTRSVVLDEAARLKAEDMAKHEYFAHFSPAGVSPWYWFDQVSYQYVHAGENLAIHFSDSGEVVDAWMNSPSHRANIVNGEYQEIGVGTAKGMYKGYETIFVVQLFGTRAINPPTSSLVVTSQTDSGGQSAVLAETIEVAEANPKPAESASTNTAMVEPEAPSVVVEPTPTQPQAPAATPTETVDPVPTSAPTTTQIQITETNVSEDMVSLYSDTVSTSTGGVPASLEIDREDQHSSRQSSILGSLVVQPTLLMQIMYAIIGIFVLAVLLISILIEIRHQRPIQIAYGMALLLLMTGLFYFHTYLTAGAVIV